MALLLRKRKWYIFQIFHSSIHSPTSAVNTHHEYWGPRFCNTLSLWLFYLWTCRLISSCWWGPRGSPPISAPVDVLPISSVSRVLCLKSTPSSRPRLPSVQECPRRAGRLLRGWQSNMLADFSSLCISMCLCMHTCPVVAVPVTQSRWLPQAPL